MNSVLLHEAIYLTRGKNVAEAAILQQPKLGLENDLMRQSPTPVRRSLRTGCPGVWCKVRRVEIVALAGGVGAAKFLSGLVQAVSPSSITIIGNTGDDAVIGGLHISPDLDIVTYSLAGLVGDQGWGLAGDTDAAMSQIRTLGGDDWFHLGDRDIGTHLTRTSWLQQGVPLSEVTDRIRRGLGVEAQLIPMSDDPVRTKLTLTDGTVRGFQEYFVRHGHSEDVAEIHFQEAEKSSPAPGVLDAISEASKIIICPSNPVISIGPILAVPGIREALVSARERVSAISPIVEGAALKGPAARLLPLLGVSATASGVATVYAELASRFVLDHRDSEEATKIQALGMEPIVTETVMETPEVAKNLAEEVIR